jgi:hypothetical protein
MQAQKVCASIGGKEPEIPTLCSVEKHSQGSAAEPQVPPLRYGATVGMTRGGRRFQEESLLDRSRFSSPERPKGSDFSGRKAFPREGR